MFLMLLINMNFFLYFSDKPPKGVPFKKSKFNVWCEGGGWPTTSSLFFRRPEDARDLLVLPETQFIRAKKGPRKGQLVRIGPDPSKDQTAQEVMDGIQWRKIRPIQT
jgi:hypothetical protein